jgi:hypothetical protein
VQPKYHKAAYIIEQGAWTIRGREGGVNTKTEARVMGENLK